MDNDASRPSARSIRTWLILPLYVVASVVLTWPTIQRFSSAIPSSRASFDPCLQAFLLGWDTQTLLTEPRRLFHPPIFYPEANTLTYMDHMLGEAVTALPVIRAFHSVAAGYNLLVLLSFLVSGWATYRLARTLGVSRAAAFLSGCLFAFSPYRYGNLDQLNQLQTQFLPLGLWFGLRYLKRFKTRDACGVSGTLVVQAYFGWYYAFYLVVALGILVLYALLTRHTFRPRWGPLVSLGVLSALLVAPVCLPYVREHLALPEFHRTLGESALYSADVTDYLKMNANAVLAGVLPVGRQPYWPGLAGVLLAMVGAARAWRRKAWDAMCLGALTLVSFVLSLGPILHLAGVKTWIPLPYALLYFIVPGFSSMRAPARFAVLVVLGVSVLAAVGYQALQERWRDRSALRRGAAAATFGLALLFAWPKSFTTVTLPSRDRLPPVYEYLAARNTGEPILELPVPAGDEEDESHSFRQYYVLYHHHPRLDGSSGFLSRRYRTFRNVVQGFPGRDALQAAQSMGAALIVIHYDDYPAVRRESLRRAVARETRLRRLAEFGGDSVYELRSEPS